MNANTGRAFYIAAAVWLVLLTIACGRSQDTFEPDSVLEIDRGVRLLEDGHLDQAYQVFDSVIRDDPRNPEAYARRGFIQLALGNIAAGLADVNRALEIDPDFGLAHNYKGLVFAMNDINDQAILEYTRAIELTPALEDAYVNRAKVYLELDDEESALADLDMALSLEPESAELLLVRAQVHLILGDTNRAEADLEQILSLPAEERTISAARQILSRIR